MLRFVVGPPPARVVLPARGTPAPPDPSVYELSDADGAHALACLGYTRGEAAGPFATADLRVRLGRFARAIDPAGQNQGREFGRSPAPLDVLDPGFDAADAANFVRDFGELVAAAAAANTAVSVVHYQPAA